MGFSDGQLAHLWDSDELNVREVREAAGVIPTYKTVDTCAAEFAAETPYHYSTYEDENEVRAAIALASSSSAAVRIGSGRASSSTTAACTHRSRSARRGTRR